MVVHLMLFGKTGAGKSATGNTVVGREVFKSAATIAAVTQRAEAAKFTEGGTEFKVVDTVGLFDERFKGAIDFTTRKELFDHVVDQFAIAVELAEKRVNVIVICISARDRVSSTEAKLPEICSKLFGGAIVSQCTLVVTNCDKFKTEDEYTEWLNSGYASSSSFRELVHACGNRVFPICNDPDFVRPWLKTARNVIVVSCARMNSYDLTSYVTNMSKLRKDLFEIAQALPKEEGGCIGFGQVVQVRAGGEVLLKVIQDLRIGDRVLTTTGYSIYLGELHSSFQNPTLTFHFGNNNGYLQVTEDHIVGGAAGVGFKLAKQFTVGEYIGLRKVEKITYEQEVWTCCPLTQSGTIIVNGAPVSCFACSAHWLAKLGFIPVTHLGLYNADIPRYVNNIIQFHSTLPQFVRQLLPVYL
jgi:predicted GTPase